MSPVQTISDPDSLMRDMVARSLDECLVKTVEYPDGFMVAIVDDQLIAVDA